MFRDHTQALFDRAAQPALERIGADLEAAPWRVRPLLAHLEKHLFDLDLNVDQLKRACGVRDNSVATQFHSAVGQPPGAYITERRLETASRLLAGTELPIWQISDLVGCSSIQVFSRCFNRWAGCSPSAYRKRAAHRREAAEMPAAPERPETLPVLRKLLSLEAVEQLEAEELWRAIRSRDWQTQQLIVSGGLPFKTPAFFEHLVRMSREEGRDDRRRGVGIARLALESLSSLEHGSSAEQLASLKVRGWAWLGNAHRMALDFASAEETFTIAEQEARASAIDLLAQAELYQNRAALRWFQRRFDEALELEGEALGRFREVGDRRLLAQSLLLKASILLYAGESEAGIPDLLEAERLLSKTEDSFLRIAVYQGLLCAYMRSDRRRETEAILPVAKALCASSGSQRVLAHFTWLEGAAEEARDRMRAAESCYLDAHARFERLGEPHHGALVAYDLASLYSSQRRYAEAMRAITEVVSVFTALNIPRDSLMAVNLLHQGAADQKAVSEVLQRIHVGLEDLRNDPARQLLQR